MTTHTRTTPAAACVVGVASGLHFLTAPLGLEYERRGQTILIRKAPAQE